jgi:putative ABC transport system ATP-binding protein
MLIDVQQLRKVYAMGATEVVALDNIDLQIDDGEFVSIMGPSGSGKSTLMHLMGCLDRPTTGQYILDGVGVATLDDLQLSKLRNQKVGFVFQNFNLIPQLTVVENIELPMLYASVKRDERRERAMQLLAAVNLASRGQHRPNELSGGERQRVAIARSLVNQPPLVLADEPTGNLDTKTGEEIMRVFQKLNELGTTVILVTHDEDVARWSRRIIRMRDGLVEQDSRSGANSATEPPTDNAWQHQG